MISKAGLEKMVEIFAAENNDSNIQVSLFDPGPIDTKIRSQAMPTEDKTKITSPKKVAKFFVKNLSNNSFKHGDVLQYPQK